MLDEALRARFADRTALVGVVGLGYVGLPLVRAFTAAGFRVLGFDNDADRVAELHAGRSYLGHMPGEWIAECLARQTFEPTTDMRRLRETDAILICVPTPLSRSREPDLSFVEEATRQIVAALRPGQLVVLESTTYPGTTRDIVLPILESSGLKVGRDFFLAYSPERQDPGNRAFSAGDIPRVVGGMDPESQRLAETLYHTVTPQLVPVSNCETAEACKILENAYRAVNIALVNELKTLFERMGIDIWEVIEAAKTKPFGFQAFYPGPGLGGHCIPIDPFYLSWAARQCGGEARLVELAGAINTAMPGHIIECLAAALASRGRPLAGARVAVLGVAYKRDIADPRESPALALLERLVARGAIATYNDPYIPILPAASSSGLPRLESSPLTPEYLAEQDCVLIATDHGAYDYNFIVAHSRVVVDTRNATRGVDADRAKIVRA